MAVECRLPDVPCHYGSLANTSSTVPTGHADRRRILAQGSSATGCSMTSIIVVLAGIFITCLLSAVSGGRFFLAIGFVAAAWMSRHEHRHLALVEHRIDDTSRCCGSAAEQILAAALGWIMRHDAIVKTARLAHQRIDVLGQQKT
jgi:hypothetical protein